MINITQSSLIGREGAFLRLGGSPPYLSSGSALPGVSLSVKNPFILDIILVYSGIFFQYNAIQVYKF